MSDNIAKSGPHYIDHRTRLRSRLNNYGIESLQSYEVIELFLTFVIPQRDVKAAAKQAIGQFKTIKGFFDADEKELAKIPYFKDKALTLRKFIKEVSLLYQKEQAVQNPISVSNTDLVKYCKTKLGYNKHEEFWLLSLDSKNSVIKEDLISRGLQDKTTVYPRQVIETAIRNSASSILLLHNHTNGDPHPSEQDKNITKAIEIPVRILNISIYDHLIVSNDNYFSFRENKII